MTVRPDFGPEYGEEERREQRVQPPAPDAGDDPEREIAERAAEDEEVEFLDPESNEAHAPGQVCARCGATISAGQEVRRRPDGRWIHEVCPV